MLMNYFEWSQEYYDTAEKIADIIERLKLRRKSAVLSEKKELDLRITNYKVIYNECMQIANHLLQRHKGVA
ncbi:hypothetical protein SAMN02910441_00720 [Ruminococcus sp. YE282]|jgi:hypothetical protein|nr:hypothetical protein SAMN02910441_00720 [Ruminococcus bromii]